MPVTNVTPVTPVTGALSYWDSLDVVERTARCRALGAIAWMLCGPIRAEALIAALRRAEHDPLHLADADAALHALPTIPMRRCIAVLIATLPPPEARRHA